MNTYFSSAKFKEEAFRRFERLTKNQEEKLKKPIVIFPIHIIKSKFSHWTAACLVRDIDISKDYSQVLLFMDSFEKSLKDEEKQKIFSTLK